MPKEEGAVPDFLRMDQPVSSDPANAKKTGNWHGWPTKDITPVTLTDNEGRTVRIRTPVMDLEGLITPTDLHYTVQHFAVPPVVETDCWAVEGHRRGQELSDPQFRPVAAASRPQRPHRHGVFRQRRHVLRVFQGRGAQTLAHPGGDDPQRQRVDRGAAWPRC